MFVRWLVIAAGLLLASSSCKRDVRRITPGVDGGPDTTSSDQVLPPADVMDGGSSEASDSIVTVPPGSVQNGQPCSTNGNCESTSCKDGVCCDTACSGPCTACTEAYTGKPNGTCGAAKAGLDPHDDCTSSAPETCGDDGMCDGASACRKYGSNQICSPAMCTGNQFSPVYTCSGTGTCANAAAVDCGIYPCTTLGCAKPCATDAECPPQNFCAAGICRTKKTDGDSCAEARECSSTRCVDKVCCATDCTGSCMACSEMLTGQRSGSCQPVQAGIDPDDNCPTDLPAMCGRDGTCDGSGACRKYDSTTKCADASCTGTMFTAARTCSNGACGGAAAVDCQSATCTAEGCRQGCTMDTDCATGSFCTAGSCVARKANGTACTTGNECTSRACVDGVCCETTCAATCFACAIAKTGQPSGRCAAVTAGTDLDNDCAAQAVTTCGTDGLCDGSGVCRRWARGTECAAGMCNAAGNYLSARTCDGAGVCEPVTTDVCAPNVCAATGCSRTCTTNTDCLGSTYCAGTMCAAKKAQGVACTAAAECTSNYCVDGVCCDGPCTAKCNACTMAKTGQTNGRCSPVPAGMDMDNECAVDTANACGLDGACNGSNACRIRTMGTSCGTGSCTVNGAGASILTPAGSCDGISMCTPGTSNACPGGFTCASATACRTMCTDNTHCVSGNVCSTGTGTCMPGVCTPNATRCSSNGLGVETCTAGGIWGAAVACTNQACPVGMMACTGVCTPGARRCAANGLGYETCTAGGAWGTTVTPCPNQACPVGMTACTGVCTPGSTQCASNGLGYQTCTAAGAWGTTVTACTNQACPVGMTACTGVCAPATRRCSGSSFQICSAAGAWGTAMACGTCQTCQGAGSCVSSGSAVTCYVDTDMDGYGNPGQSQAACGTCPSGYVTNGSDCYDDNILAFPGQTDWFTANRGDGSWDYNCVGGDEKQLPLLTRHDCNICTCTGTSSPIACGQESSTFCQMSTCSFPGCSYVLGPRQACH